MENAPCPAKLIIWHTARRSGSENAQTVTDVGKHEKGDFIEWTITIRALISNKGTGGGLYHDNLIYLGSHRPLHAGPPLNGADHRGGKHHLLSVLKATALLLSFSLCHTISSPHSLLPEKLHFTGRMNILTSQRGMAR